MPSHYLTFIELILIGLAGGLANYTVQFYKGHITCDFKSYLTGALPATLKSLGSIIIAALGLIVSDNVDLQSPLTFVAMFKSAYIIDNLLNKAPTQE